MFFLIVSLVSFIRSMQNPFILEAGFIHNFIVRIKSDSFFIFYFYNNNNYYYYRKLCANTRDVINMIFEFCHEFNFLSSFLYLTIINDIEWESSLMRI